LPITLKYPTELLQFPESYDSLGSGHGAVSASTILHAIAVDTRCRPAVVDASACFVTALVVDVLDVEGMDVAGEVAQDSEQDVNEQIRTATGDKKDADRRDENSYDDEKDSTNHSVLVGLVHSQLALFV